MKEKKEESTLHIDHGDRLPEHWNWEERQAVLLPKDHMVQACESIMRSSFHYPLILAHPELGLWRPQDKTHWPRKPLGQD